MGEREGEVAAEKALGVGVFKYERGTWYARNLRSLIGLSQIL
jgi:hypothetical protein